MNLDHLCFIRHTGNKAYIPDRLPGSSPGGSREFEVGMESASGKGLFNQKYKERLGTNSIVGKLVEKRG